VDAGVDQHRVVGRDPELVAPQLVDDRVDLRHLRRIGPDVDGRRVLVVAELEVAPLVLELPGQRLLERDLATCDPVPLLLQLGGGGDGEVAVRRRVDRTDVDDPVLDADVAEREHQGASDRLQRIDPLDHVGVERGLGLDHQVGEDQRALARPRRVDGVSRVGDRGRRAGRRLGGRCAR
jgi:hypothetical protein